MKLFILAAVFSSTFVIAFATSDQNQTLEQESIYSKQEEAAKYCNTIYPVTEDTRRKLGLFVLKGDTIPKTFNTTEWCNLYCNLEKVGFFDAEGKMQVRRIFKYVIRTLPEIAPNSHTLLVQLFQISRSTKGMEDKCMKAFVAYYRFTEAIMVATMAIDLNANTDVREQVIESVLTGDDLPKELETNIEKYLKHTDTFFKKIVEEAITNTTSATPIPSN